MTREITRRCECCGLPFKAADRGDMYNVTDDVSPGFRKPQAMHCQECRYHQGDSDGQRLKKLEAHESELRRAKDAAADWAKKAEREVSDLRRRVGSALQSRDQAIDILAKVQDIHTMKPDGACTCGIKKDCRTAQAIYGRWTQEMILRRAPRNE